MFKFIKTYLPTIIFFWHFVSIVIGIFSAGMMTVVIIEYGVHLETTGGLMLSIAVTVCGGIATYQDILA